PNYKELFFTKTIEYPDISNIIELTDSNITKYTIDTFQTSAVYDTLKNKIKDSSLTIIDSSELNTYKKLERNKLFAELQYPNKNKKLLYPFFDELKTLKKSNNLIRILHYGDSQIESDRITSYIRNKLQKKFGGCGIGLFPPVLIKGTNLSMSHNLSGYWSRYTLQSIKNKTINHKHLGILMSYGKFSPIIDNKKNEIYNSSIELQKSNISYLLTRKFEHCKIFYGYNKKPFIVELKINDKVIDAEMLTSSYNLKTLEYNFSKPVDNININFKGEKSPDIYGISLDGKKGIAVDNIALRGSSGTDFTRTDIAFLRSMFQELNVKLILFQFGVNVVPYVIENYDYYEKQLYKQLKLFKKMRPNINIIVMGVSDMSHKNNGIYVSYPNIEKIRDAQINAAFKAGCAFWDTYEAMGGKNSMPQWVYANPPLARKDFTHYTYKGSLIIGKLFYDALNTDYKRFIEQ
ncbi:MAG: hypothetical protein PF487_07190, partial [Bacteroidales bacterium]|nr:hypothetical protein [Bacteroidales bacterium]